MADDNDYDCRAIFVVAIVVLVVVKLKGLQSKVRGRVSRMEQQSALFVEL